LYEKAISTKGSKKYRAHNFIKAIPEDVGGEVL
jgi:hypothetical protein